MSERACAHAWGRRCTCSIACWVRNSLAARQPNPAPADRSATGHFATDKVKRNFTVAGRRSVSIHDCIKVKFFIAMDCSDLDFVAVTRGNKKPIHSAFGCRYRAGIGLPGRRLVAGIGKNTAGHRPI